MSADKHKKIIQVNSLSFSYPSSPDKKALDNINLSIHEGDFLGIVGPSGAGKTTLCLALRGLIPHAQTGSLTGSVKINGQSTMESKPAELTKTVGIVFQDPESQIVGMTIEEDVMYSMQNLCLPSDYIRERASEVIKLVELSGMEHRDTIALSGGQKQRLTIASALAVQPNILILDEPTSELDPSGKAEVFSVLRSLRESGEVTIIIVEHELEELAENCNKIIIMNEGQVVQSGSPGEIFRDSSVLEGVIGGRIPQVCEISMKLVGGNLMDEKDFAWTEDNAVQVLTDRFREMGLNTNE